MASFIVNLFYISCNSSVPLHTDCSVVRAGEMQLKKSQDRRDQAITHLILLCRLASRLPLGRVAAARLSGKTIPSVRAARQGAPKRPRRRSCTPVGFRVRLLPRQRRPPLDRRRGIQIARALRLDRSMKNLEVGHFRKREGVVGVVSRLFRLKNTTAKYSPLEAKQNPGTWYLVLQEVIEAIRLFLP